MALALENPTELSINGLSSSPRTAPFTKEASASTASWMCLASEDVLTYDVCSSGLVLPMRSTTDAAFHQHESHLSEVQTELDVLREAGDRGKFLASDGQCPLLPPEPHKETMLSAGALPEAMERTQRIIDFQVQRSAALNSAFESKCHLFANWQRLDVIVGSHSPVSNHGDGVHVLFGPLPSPAPAGGEHDNSQLRCLATRPQGIPAHRFYQPYAPRFIQGRLDDSFFLLAVSSIIHHKLQFSSLFASLEGLRRGAATFRFFDDGFQFDPLSRRRREVTLSFDTEPKLVTVDTLIPVSHADATSATKKILFDPVFGATALPGDGWLMLLEKAYATFCGSYAALDSGCALQALVHLTGGKPRIVSWCRPSATSPDAPVHVSPAAVDRIWWILQESTRLALPTIAFQQWSADAGRCADSDQVAFASYDASVRMFNDVNWKAHGIAVLCVCVYDSTVEIPQDIYARLLGRPTKRGIVHRLVKVRSVFGGRPKTMGSLSWEWDSPLWTPQAASHLSRDDSIEDTSPGTSVAWWMTVDEFCTMCNSLAVVEDAAVSATWSSFASVQVADEASSLTNVAPQFGLRVLKPTQLISAAMSLTKSVQGDARSGAEGTNDGVETVRSAAAALSAFSSLKDIIDHVPQFPLPDAGEETEDDDDVSAGTGGGDVAGGLLKAPLLSDVFRNKSAATLEVRVSVPVSQLDDFQYQVHLYRVSGGASNDAEPVMQRVECCSSLTQGTLRWELPLHGRVPWRSLTDTPVVAAAGSNEPPQEKKSLAFPSADAYSNDGEMILQPQNPLDGCVDSLPAAHIGSYFGEAELSEGAYAIVVVPQRRTPSDDSENVNANQQVPVLRQSKQLLMFVTARCVAPDAAAAAGGAGYTPSYRFDLQAL